MRNLNNTKGFVAYIVLFLIIFGLLGIYFGRSWYLERYYVTLYDGRMTRYLDVPPFAERTSSANDELRGYCVLSMGSSADQALGFLKSVCDKTGYIFNSHKDGAEIEVRKNYIVKCDVDKGKLVMTWTPNLTDSLKSKCQKLYPKLAIKDAKSKKKRKHSKK